MSEVLPFRAVYGRLPCHLVDHHPSDGIVRYLPGGDHTEGLL